MAASSAIIEYYGRLTDEINRQKDREWLYASLFAVSGWLIIAQVLRCPPCDLSEDAKKIYQVALAALALANIFFTAMAHMNLARNRVIQVRLILDKLPEIKKALGGGDALWRQRENWWWQFNRDFWDHAAISLVVSILAYVVGAYLLRPPEYKLAAQVAVPIAVLATVRLRNAYVSLRGREPKGQRPH